MVSCGGPALPLQERFRAPAQADMVACMQARYVQERRRTVATGAPHSNLLLEKPSLLLHPTPGADAPNTELAVNEGGQFERQPAQKAYAIESKVKKMSRGRGIGLCDTLPLAQSLMGGHVYCCSERRPPVLGGCEGAPEGTGGVAPFAGGHADLQFAGPALVLPEVQVHEDGTLSVPSDRLPEGWHACAAPIGMRLFDRCRSKKKHVASFCCCCG